MSSRNEVLVFHANEQHSLATTIVDGLLDAGLKARSLANLNSELPDILPSTHLVVLLWSKDAQSSSSFETGWITAFQNWRTIITIPCDDVAPPIQATTLLYKLKVDVELGRAIHDLSYEIKKLIKTSQQTPILIPSGDFYVGSYRDQTNAYPNEPLLPRPFGLAHDYHIFRFPVLVSDYRLFIESSQGYNRSKYWTKAGWLWKEKNGIESPAGWKEQNTQQYDRYAVTGVSFFEAVAYCNWYNEYRSDGYLYRLPTETEWEKAARGGIYLVDNQVNEAPFRIWTWKGVWDNGLANTAESRRRKPISVDDHPEKSYSPYGVVAMAGNLLEWCINFPDNYPSLLVDIPEGGQNRMARGGAYIYSQRDARCSRRMEFSPTQRQHMSFRIASVKKTG